jgi:hypothetical protein
MILSRNSRSECVNSMSVFGRGKGLLQKSDNGASYHIIPALANSKADTRNSLVSWTVSLRSGFEVAPGQNCRMIPLSNPLAFDPAYRPLQLLT